MLQALYGSAQTQGQHWGLDGELLFGVMFDIPGLGSITFGSFYYQYKILRGTR